MATKIDLFERVETLPPVIQGILSEYSECENDYETCEVLHSELLSHGYTFDWGLDAITTTLNQWLSLLYLEYS